MEIGFSKILVIMLLALLVLGPEKLPKVAAQLGRWTGRARAMARNLRMQLEQEVSYDELRREKEKAEAALRAATSTQPMQTPTAEPVAATPPMPTAMAASPENELHQADMAHANQQPAHPDTAHSDERAGEHSSSSTGSVT